MSPDASLQHLFEKLVSNIDNWAINTKCLIILHRGLQNIKVNRKIYRDLKEREHLLHPYEPKPGKEPGMACRTYAEISQSYTNYLKVFLGLAHKTDILTKRMNRLTEEVHALRDVQLLKNSEHFETCLSQGLKQLRWLSTCRQTRLWSNFVFMVFKDITKIYKVYACHVTELLDRFPKLSKQD